MRRIIHQRFLRNDPRLDQFPPVRRFQTRDARARHHLRVLFILVSNIRLLLAVDVDDDGGGGGGIAAARGGGHVVFVVFVAGESAAAAAVVEEDDVCGGAGGFGVEVFVEVVLVVCWLVGCMWYLNGGLEGRYL